MTTLLLLDNCRRTRRELYGLPSERYRVHATHSIFAAFRGLRRRQYDLIVVCTANGDGFAIAVLKWLSMHRCATPAVALFGAGSARGADRVRQLGASAVLRMPAPARSIRAAAASAVASSPKPEASRASGTPCDHCISIAQGSAAN